MTKRTPKAKCLNPDWVYIPAVETDIGKRFRKIIAEQKRAAALKPAPNVSQIRLRAK